MRKRSRTSMVARKRGYGSSESATLNAILRYCQRPHIRLYRQNTGAFAIGSGAGKRFVRAGLCKGSSDIIGWKSVPAKVNGEMRDVAIFVALEVKSEKGRVRREQAAFLNDVADSGGIAGVVRSIADAQRILGP